MLPVSCLETEQDVAGQIDRVSPELWAAQERLTKIRRQRKATQQVYSSSLTEHSHGRFAPPPSPLSEPLLPSIQSHLANLPAHLGWGSATLTAVLRPPHHSPLPSSAGSSLQPTRSIETPAQRPSPTAVLKLYPDLALAMLRKNLTAVGRIWLLLRTIDAQGVGWVDEQTGRMQLTDRDSTQRVCGWRQLRNLLRQGEGVFWQRNNGRIWLASVAKVAAALQVEKLVQRPVAVPVAVLTKGLGVVRAHFYASFHSSRQANDNGRRKPIARATLNELSAVTPKTQRTYERKALVEAQANFAVGQASSPEQRQETCWRKGKASFEFVDHNGRQGKPDASYVAWQLPNSYCGPHPKMARGRQKRINRELTDLFMKGMTGNGQKKIDHRDCLARRYFRNGRFAAQALNHAKIGGDVYWCSPNSGHQAAAGRIWHVFTQPE